MTLESKRELIQKSNLLTITLLSCLAIILSSFKVAYAETKNSSDSLYITDVGDNTVKEFDFQGNLIQTIVDGTSPPLNGPMGVVVRGNSLIASNQNFGGTAGEIFSYNTKTGNFVRTLVSQDNPNAPFAPRGIILRNEVLYVADLQGPGECTPLSTVCPNGQLLAFMPNRKLVGKLSGSSPDLQALLQGPLQGQFHPRSVVLGPDGYLYFSIRNLPQPCGGSVLRTNPDFTNVSIVVTNSVNCTANVNDLHRPEGLVFGPDGKLYVTSFRKDATDTDKILIFDQSGKKLGQIELDVVGQPRAFAQAILFGPDGYLYVPIQNTGEVRRCDVTKTTCLGTEPVQKFIAPGILAAPNYLSFGKTDAATLEYSKK